MNPQQARARVAETFPQPFHKGKFLEFSRNLLNKFDESKAAQWNATYVKDAFKPHVSRFERLGTYTSPDDEKLDVLVVHLTNESKLERARTAIRNFVADHLKTRDEKDAALVAFVSPTEQQWRFSYVKMEYAAVETEAGRVGVETRLTPARRYSYIVGEGESCHTAQTRFLALLQDTENYPTLAQIEEAFSVEAVTWEFFNQYAVLFAEIDAALQKLAAKDKTIGSEFKEKNVSTVDFAKKLMGQIVFLYFLQKKGWLGVAKGQDWGTGPHDFLRRLARGDYGAYENFFNDALEPLFYDTLATDRGHEAWCNRFKRRIPFLNGGLFEPLADYDWRKTDIILPNKLFTNTDRDEKTGDIGTGILDVFDRYNFTVNEAEPLEKEVAIDPEMLGKVFENLIEENRRKGLGSFYTPRDVVHYMCQESLINYLDTALNTDNEIVPRKDLETFIYLGDQISHYEAVEARYTIKMPKSIEQHARRIDEKLAEVLICDPAVGSGAFPVGMMTEIVRARSALTPYFNDVHDRTAYHFKRHAIQNSLYGVDIDLGAVEIAKLRLWLSLVVDEEDVKQIKPLPNLDYKIVVGNSLLGVEKTLFNEKFFQQLEKLKPLYFDESDSTKKASLRRQIDDLIHELTNGKEAFDFEIYFSEVFHKKRGFDLVVGNPPYLNFKSYSSADRELYRQLYREIFDGKADLLYYFIFKGMTLANAGGYLSFITSRYWLEAEFAAKLRTYVSGHYGIREILDFSNAVIFDQGIKVAISTLAKTRDSRDVFRFLSYIGKKFEGLGADKLEVCFVKQSKLLSIDDRWIFVGAEGSSLLSKITKDSVPLDDIAFCKQGIVTGRDRAFVFEAKSPVSELPDSVIKPWIKVGDVHGYAIRPVKKRFLVYANDLDKISDYPKFHDGLKKHSEKLRNRREVKNGRIRWFDLQWPREKRFFDNEKLICRFKAERNTFALDTDGRYCSADITLVILKDEFRGKFKTKYLLALLNSRLLDYHFKSYAKLMDYRYEYYPKPVSLLRIKQASEPEQKRFVALVERILGAKQRDAEADTSALEREIDELVYALYGLTPEEKALVQAAAK
ncbi:MAG: Eco57I restriction-modification methylase domain-containing protein [Verrucomicrobia bacterium]|nr:Eco57I restriction-modification methylase domain-containing protein [Verrucomicrobiota bacterium]